MARNITIGNGNLFVGFDGNGQVKELFYPYASAGNHAGNNKLNHKIGIFCDGTIHWLDDGTWQIKQEYYPGKLISQTICNNNWLDLRLELQDFVDNELNILSRNIHIINLSKRQRNLKLYLHQSFCLNGACRQEDTAVYLPSNISKQLNHHTAIVHFNHSTAVLVTGQNISTGIDFDEFSIGKYGDYGNQHMDGVWCDAADGVLSGNDAETGNTDSILGFSVLLSPHESACINYQLTVASTVAEAVTTAQKFLHEGLEFRLRKTTEYWNEWLKPAITAIRNNTADEYKHDLVDALIDITSVSAMNGAVYSASPLSSMVNEPLVNPANSGIVALCMAKLGYELEAGRIFDFFIEPIKRDSSLYPTYYGNGAPGIGKLSMRNGSAAVKPVRIIDSAALLLSLCQVMTHIASDNGVSAAWKKRWNKLGINLANILSDAINPITKLPNPSYSLRTDRPLSSALDASLTYLALSAAADVAELTKDVDNIIKYNTVANDIAENIGQLWNENRNYFYAGINHIDDDVVYDSSIYSINLIAAKLSGLFDAKKIELAEQTLKDLHLYNNGTYSRHQNDNVDSEYDLGQLMTLSLIGNLDNQPILSSLLNSYRTVLNRGGYKLNLNCLLASNDIMLKSLFILFNLNNQQGYKL